MQQNPNVILCFAVREEARFFQPAPHWSHQAAVRITGMGMKNASRVLAAQLERQLPHLVLTCGFAGGLNPQLVRGTVLFSADEQTSLPPALLKLGAVAGRFHCMERVAVTASEKELLWRETGADAVEMESQVIRDMCRQRSIPSATIRVISDAAGEDLPLDFNALMTPEQNLNYFKLAGTLLRSPGRIPALLQLQKRTTIAARALGHCLTELLKDPGIGSTRSPVPGSFGGRAD